MSDDGEEYPRTAARLPGRPAAAGGLAEGEATYYSSPVGADGKVYLLGQGGQLTVVSAEPQWRVLYRAHFGANTYATPALLDENIYLRTDEYLYYFGEK